MKIRTTCRYNHTLIATSRRTSLTMSWRNNAACANTKLEVFFDKDSIPLALSICETCKVVQACRKDAVENERIRIGIRGGMTPRQRQVWAKNAV